MTGRGSRGACIRFKALGERAEPESEFAVRPIYAGPPGEDES